MTEIESNVESFHVSQNTSCGAVESDDLTVTSNDGDIRLTVTCGAEIEEESTISDEAPSVNGIKENGVEETPSVNGIKGDSVDEAPAVNGINGDTGEHDSELKPESPKPRLEKLSDSTEKSPQVGRRSRKSSMERLLEESLDTTETPDDVYIERKLSHSSEASTNSTDGENTTVLRPRKSSIYEQKNIQPPAITKGNIISSRTQNLFNQYQRDITVHEVKPMINVNEENNVNSTSNEENENKTKIDLAREEKEAELREIKRQYQQRLIDEEREKSEERAKKKEVKLNTIDLSEEDADVFIDPNRSPSSRTSTSSNASLDAAEGGAERRRTSIYDQKQIEPPCPTRGNIIASRTEHLFKQYSKDMTSHVAKPIDITEGSETIQAKDEGTATDEEKTKMEITREQTKRELQEVRLQFQQRLAQEEREKAEERAKRNAASGLKSRSPLGSHMNRYVAVTRGETVDKVDDEEEEVDGQLNVDQQGVVIEKSGGKVEIVKSSDSISDIKSKFGGSHKWKKEDTETPLEEVDKMKVDSARSVFKEKETKKEENTMFNRPTSKKVRDAKELMDIRKKATYGQEDESEDGVVHKSVEIEKEQVDPSCKKNALNMYKNLEKKEENKGPLQKPKTRLLTDMEARASMEGIRSISSSASEASDVNETANDLTLDTVSGYGSAAPCSPSSTFSEDYLSDTKETSKVDELKEVSPVILPTDDEPILTIEAKIETNGIDDSSLLINGHIDEPSVVDEAVPVNTEFV